MLKLTIHSTGSGIDALSGKEGDGLTVSFDDNTIRETFLSWKSFKQMCGMKLPAKTSPPKPAIPMAAPAVAAPVTPAKVA